MHLILRRSLIFVALMVAGLALYAIWFGIKADRYDETVVPYLQQAVPELASWRYDRLKPLLSPDARLDFDNDSVQAAYRKFDRLGALVSMEKPQYLASNAGTSKALGDIEMLEYQVDARFESGPATIKLKLIADGQSYYLHHFSFQSEIFAAGE